MREAEVAHDVDPAKQRELRLLDHTGRLISAVRLTAVCHFEKIRPIYGGSRKWLPVERTDFYEMAKAAWPDFLPNAKPPPLIPPTSAQYETAILPALPLVRPARPGPGHLLRLRHGGPAHRDAAKRPGAAPV